MRITGGGFVAGMAMAALVAVAAVPLLWDRHRFRLITRTATVLVATALTVASAGLIVNAQGDFYPTLDSLFGGDPSGLVTGQSGVRAALGAAPSQAAIDAAGRLRGRNQGVVLRIELAGVRTHIVRPAAIYLPNAYFDPAMRGFSFPVIEMLHGSPGNPDGVLRMMQAQRDLDQAIAAGYLPPVVAVIPMTNQSGLHDNECIDAVGGTPDDTYLTADLRAAVIAHFRVRSDRAGWATLGYSTGGYCAVNLAMRHPQWYGAAVNLSGPLTPTVDATTGNLFRGSRAAHDSNDPLITVMRLQSWPLAVYLYAGIHEEPDLRQDVLFSREARLPISVTLAVDHRGRAGHNFRSWRDMLPSVFAWLGRHIAGAVPTDALSRPHVVIREYNTPRDQPAAGQPLDGRTVIPSRGERTTRLHHI